MTGLVAVINGDKIAGLVAKLLRMTVALIMVKFVKMRKESRRENLEE